MRTPSPRAIALLCAAASGAALTALFGFGPLDPPDGPIAPTYKTLAEVEPRTAINAANTPGDADSVFRITTAGSYYLAAPLSVPSGRSGIEIANSNVTIDLAGFRIGGQNASLDGIVVNGALFGITIRNGTIFSCDGDGIDAADDRAVRIQGVNVIDNTGQGITVGDGSEVSSCTAEGNGSHGINASHGCRIIACSAADNGGIGIDVDGDSAIRDSIALRSGTDGISAGEGCTVTGCTASFNTGNGINTTDTCIVTASVGRLNGGVGIDVDNSSVIRDSAARDNTGDGITANNGCVIASCATGVNETGFAAGTMASISGCTTYANRADGIVFAGQSFVFGNNTNNNAVAGLRASGSGGRVDANQTTGNEIGLALDGSGCDVHRNTVHLNQAAVTGDADDRFKWPAQLPWDNMAF